MQEHPVIRQVHRAVQKLLPQGAKVILAVSGGADSMALAAAVHSLVQAKLCQAWVVHVEHGLRGAEALQDAALVEQFCQQRELPYSCVHVQVKKLVEQEKLSVEDAARRLRYQALYQWVDKVQADYLLTAHHRDDQAETVLLKLVRGAGITGLAGMRQEQGRLLRPFLFLPRLLLEEYCHLQGISYCYDSSNGDLHYSRNRMRQELLPYLEKYFNPKIKDQLAQTAAILQEDALCLDTLAREQLQLVGTRQERGWLIQIAAWRQQPAALRKRVLRQAYFQLTEQPLSHALTEALDVLCLTGHSGKTLQLSDGLVAEYAYGQLALHKQIKQEVQEAWRLEVPLEAGTVFQHRGRQYCLRCFQGAYPGLQLPGLIYPWQLLLGRQLCLRSRLPGDRFHPYGSQGSKKLKAYLIDKKIPRSLRDEQVLLCSADQVLGIFGLANGAWPSAGYGDWLIVECRSI